MTTKYDSDIRFRNVSGDKIHRGAPVMLVGAVGQHGLLTGTLMDASDTANAEKYLGVAASDVVDGAEGHLRAFGDVRAADTSAWEAGDVLYCDPGTPGALTATRPASGLVFPVAIVSRAHADQGVLQVKGTPAQSSGVTVEKNPITGEIEVLANGKKIQFAEIHPYYHFHGFAGDQFSGDSKFYDKAAGNHGSFGANLSRAQAWATAGYVSTVEPVAGAVDSVIRIPSLNFDYSGGEKLIVWGLGAITPEGADASLMGDCPFAQVSLGGVRVRAKANGKLDIVVFGAGSVGRYSGASTAVPFDGALHSYAFALDGTAKKYGMWVDEAYEPVFGPDYSAFSAGQDADTRNPGTWNIGAASAAPGGTEGMATRHRALVILRMPASAEMPSVATLTALFKQLRANPGRLILAGAI